MPLHKPGRALRIVTTNAVVERENMNPLLVLADPPPDNEGAAESPRIVLTVWRGIAPHALRKRVFAFRRQRREARTMSPVTRVPLAHLMLGDQGGEPANRYAQLVRDWLYPSRSIAASPHVALLQEFEQRGDEVLADSFLPTTAYYGLAADCIRVTGQYRDATRPADIRDEVRRFLGDYRAEKARVASQQPPAAERPLEVRKIAHSECFQIVDGHHRAAIAHQLGATDISAVVTERPVLTLLQAVLLSGSWLQGRFELYQPIDSPELKKNGNSSASAATAWPRLSGSWNSTK